MQGIYTTSNVAKILGSSPATISRLFDKGILKGYRIPGSKHRRIPEKNLVKFMEEYNIPFEILKNRLHP